MRCRLRDPRIYPKNPNKVYEKSPSHDRRCLISGARSSIAPSIRRISYATRGAILLFWIVAHLDPVLVRIVYTVRRRDWSALGES